MSAKASIPLVSLIIPTHGRRALLGETMASIVAQTQTRWEAIVIDDRSPDDTASWLAELAEREPRVRPLSIKTGSGGANVARNLGVAASVGKYVIFLDSDDLLDPECLRLRIKILEADPSLDFIVHAMRCFHESINDCDLAWNSLTDEDDFERFLLMDGPWQTTGATWRRTALDRIGPWDESMLSLQDLDFHLRALSCGLTYRKINAWDCHYRLPINRGSTITSKSRTLPHFRSHMVIGYRLLQLSDAILDQSPRRRDYLVGLCYLLAKRCADKGDVRAAIRLWAAVRQRGLIPGRCFAQGIVVLAGPKRASLSMRLRRYTSDRWPVAWQLQFRDTFLQTSLPQQMSDSLV